MSSLRNFYNLNKLFSIEDLMKARCHLGHKEQLTNPYMRPYLLGKRLGTVIIDLEKTSEQLDKALLVTAEIAYRNGIILFINSNRQTTLLVEDTAKQCGEYAYARPWTSRVFTDSTNVFGAVTRLPDLCIMLSTFSGVEPHKAVTTSAKMMIPTVAICDSNSDPTLITYPIAGNDDTPESIELYARLFKTAIMNAKQKRKEVIEQYGEDYYYKSLE